MPTKHQLARYPEHVQAIGMISLETVDLELQLALLFSRMLQISPKVGEAIYMSPKSDQARLDVMRNTAHAAFDPGPRSKPDSILEQQKKKALKKMLDIVAQAESVIQYRHRTLHDDWRIERQHKEVQRIQVDGHAARVPTPVSLTELNRQITKMRTLIDDVTILAKEFKAHPPRMVSMKISP